MFIVIEIQKNSNGTIGTIVNSYNDRNGAEQKYHQILAAAAISQVEIHSAVLLSETGQRIKGESYTHYAEPINTEPNENE